jgi:hypothetical protein
MNTNTQRDKHSQRAESAGGAPPGFSGQHSQRAGSVGGTPPKLPGKSANNVHRKAFTFVEALVVIAIVGLLLGLMGPPLVQIPFLLAFGWIWGLCRLFTGLRHEPAAIGMALVALLFLPLVFHLFAAPFAKRRKMIWSFRQSCLASFCTVFMAVAGIAVISGFHDAVWFFYPKEPIISTGTLKARYRMGSANTLKQFGRGVQNYHDTYKYMPSGGTVLEDGSLGHSWMTQLLPFCEQKMVYEKIDLTKPWNDPQNAPVFKERLRQSFESPYFGRLPEEERYDPNGFAKTDYAGNQFVLPVGRSLKFDEITNGLSNTILIGEVTQNLSAWSSPLNSRDPRLGINRSPYGFGSKHVGGINFVHCDGSVQFYSETIDPKVLEAIAKPDNIAAESEKLLFP